MPLNTISRTETQEQNTVSRYSYTLTQEENDKCLSTHEMLDDMPYPPGNPDEPGHWWNWDKYTTLRAKNFCRYWEYLMFRLKQEGLPHSIEDAVKYTVCSEHSVTFGRFSWICDYPPESWATSEDMIILWLKDNPQYINAE